ncbi:uncharacterized protein LOC62_02G002861 [Vanrija pseudolonga]|uniref:Uncharacterized protein n=1 Tax=Vanrija pseudolonga TaxID=143232 RepID=A0AAF0Y4M9_9TREE|nr:hypothetical protein LOC62_02G002861 [Vanrija pseudolonga]
MKTTTIVTALAVASIATAAPTPANPDAALEKKGADPNANSDDTFTHILVERIEKVYDRAGGNGGEGGQGGKGGPVGPGGSTSCLEKHPITKECLKSICGQQ